MWREAASALWAFAYAVHRHADRGIVQAEALLPVWSDVLDALAHDATDATGRGMGRDDARNPRDIQPAAWGPQLMGSLAGPWLHGPTPTLCIDALQTPSDKTASAMADYASVPPLAACEVRPGPPWHIVVTATGELCITCTGGLPALVGIVALMCDAVRMARVAKSDEPAQIEPQTHTSCAPRPDEAPRARGSADTPTRPSPASPPGSTACLAAKASWRLRVRPNLQPLQRRARAAQGAQELDRAILEMGLGKRPIHLWLGPAALSECLSPYCRDLGPNLVAWGRAREMLPAAFDQDDAAYAVLPAFLHAHRHLPLLAEKQAAEHQVGLQRLEIRGLNVDIIDTGRLAPEAWDARLPSGKPSAENGTAPIIVRLDADAEGDAARLLRCLPEGWQARLRSLVAIVAADMAPAQAGDVMTVLHFLPDTGGPLCRWGADMPGLQPARLTAFGGAMHTGHTLRDLSCAASSLPPDCMGHATPAPGADTVGQTPLFAAMHDILLAGTNTWAGPSGFYAVHTVAAAASALPPDRYLMARRSAALACAVLDACLWAGRDVGRSEYRPVARGLQPKKGTLVRQRV